MAFHEFNKRILNSINSGWKVSEPAACPENSTICKEVKVLLNQTHPRLSFQQGNIFYLSRCRSPLFLNTFFLSILKENNLFYLSRCQSPALPKAVPLHSYQTCPWGLRGGKNLHPHVCYMKLQKITKWKKHTYASPCC